MQKLCTVHIAESFLTMLVYGILMKMLLLYSSYTGSVPFSCHFLNHGVLNIGNVCHSVCSECMLVSAPRNMCNGQKDVVTLCEFNSLIYFRAFKLLPYSLYESITYCI